MKIAITLTAAAALLAGCSNIATVNGIPVNRDAEVSTQGTPPFCAANPAVCIIGGVVAVGALGYLVDQANQSSNDDGDATTNGSVDPDTGLPV